jgi:hypothetical protein
MRPKGEITQALLSKAPMHGDGGATWKCLAAAAQVGLGAARTTSRNLLRSGELVVVGETRAPGVCRPMLLLARSTSRSSLAKDSGDGGLDLVRCWSRHG